MDDSRNGDDLEFVVEPFQFEPTCEVPDIDYSDEETSDESSNEGALNENHENPPMDLDEWCTCANCSQMPTQLECCCCRQFARCTDIMDEEDLGCITEYEGFIVNCLNTHVLRLAFYEYLDYHGHVGDDEPIHELFRYISYRRYTRMIWGRLGKKNRKVIPSCVVLKIRQTFQSQQYSGFKYPTDY